MIAFFSKLIAKLYLPKTHLYHGQIDTIMKIAQVGDVLLTRDKWNFANIFIPGFWSHTAVIVDYNKDMRPIVLEATTKGSRTLDLEDFLYSHDYVSLWRSRHDRSIAIQRTYRCFVGIPYDYEFSMSPKANYCAEIVVRLFTAVHSFCKFMTEKTLGMEYYAPDTYLQSGDWTKVVDTREDGGLSHDFGKTQGDEKPKVAEEICSSP